MKQLCERQQRSGGQCYGEFGIGDMKLAGSHATELIVSAHDEDANLYLSVADNGIGGADVGKGSGLVGLNDRVEALGGKMTIFSTPGSGTSLDVIIPVGTMQATWSSSRETQSLLLTH